MKKLILSALLGMLFFTACETSLQTPEEFLLEEEIIESPGSESQTVYAYHLDKMEGSSICSALSVNFQEKINTNTTNDQGFLSYKTKGDFTTHTGLQFKFSATYANGKVRGVGSVKLSDESNRYLSYNITSMASADNQVVFQGIITRSENFSDKYSMGNVIVFKLEDNQDQKDDRYNAAFYAFPPDLDQNFYNSQVWLDCGDDCFPESYFVNIQNGQFIVD